MPILNAHTDKDRGLARLLDKINEQLQGSSVTCKFA